MTIFFEMLKAGARFAAPALLYLALTAGPAAAAPPTPPGWPGRGTERA
ncbi:hypothetical protein [Phenylobacterium sp.]|nr:hypothetical protein [Phenylobacterium sp.]MDP3852174.1 hypothetical protein [Phenylobacterium sp.]